MYSFFLRSLVQYSTHNLGYPIWDDNFPLRCHDVINRCFNSPYVYMHHPAKSTWKGRLSSFHVMFFLRNSFLFVKI